MTDSKTKIGSKLMVAALATTMALLGTACDDGVFSGTTTTTVAPGTTTTTVAAATTTSTSTSSSTTQTTLAPTTTTTVPAGPPPLIGALTVTLDFSAGATITACGASLDALLGPAPSVATGIAGTVATIGAIDAEGIDASAGLVYVFCSAGAASATGDYTLTITEATDTAFADITANVAVVVSSTDGSCHPAAGANDLCLTVTTSP